jgi:hypothetical protein
MTHDAPSAGHAPNLPRLTSEAEKRFPRTNRDRMRQCAVSPRKTALRKRPRLGHCRDGGTSADAPRCRVGRAKRVPPGSLVLVGLAVLGPPYKMPEGENARSRLKPGLQRSIGSGPTHQDYPACQAGRPRQKERKMISDNSVRRRRAQAPPAAKSRGGACGG